MPVKYSCYSNVSEPSRQQPWLSTKCLLIPLYLQKLRSKIIRKIALSPLLSQNYAVCSLHNIKHQWTTALEPADTHIEVFIPIIPLRKWKSPWSNTYMKVQTRFSDLKTILQKQEFASEKKKNQNENTDPGNGTLWDTMTCGYAGLHSVFHKAIHQKGNKYLFWFATKISKSGDVLKEIPQ